MTGKDHLKFEARILRKIIRGIMKELDDHHKNVNIATATGSAASVVGGGKIAIFLFVSSLHCITSVGRQFK